MDKSIPLYEDGHVTRDFVFVEDVVSSILATIAKPPLRSHRCDIRSGRASTIEELASTIAWLYDAPPPNLCGTTRAS